MDTAKEYRESRNARSIVDYLISEIDELMESYAEYKVKQINDDLSDVGNIINLKLLGENEELKKQIEELKLQYKTSLKRILGEMNVDKRSNIVKLNRVEDFILKELDENIPSKY